MSADVETTTDRMLERAPRSMQVLAFIKAEIAAGRPFPSHGTIARHMGWKNLTAARDVLGRLACRGLLVVVERRHVGPARWATTYRLAEQQP